MKALNATANGKRILFANFPADGHFNPLTSLAMHLTELGFDVRWYTSKRRHRFSPRLAPDAQGHVRPTKSDQCFYSWSSDMHR